MKIRFMLIDSLHRLFEYLFLHPITSFQYDVADNIIGMVTCNNLRYRVLQFIDYTIFIADWDLIRKYSPATTASYLFSFPTQLWIVSMTASIFALKKNATL